MQKKNYLYTAKQISDMEIFGPKEIITPYKITQNWAKKGLKFVRGTKKEMLFKLEWINEYIENEAKINQINPDEEETNGNLNINFTKVY